MPIKIANNKNKKIIIYRWKKHYSSTLKSWNLRLHNIFPGDEIQRELMSFYANKMKGIILELLGIARIPRQNWNFEKIHILTLFGELYSKSAIKL